MTLEKAVKLLIAEHKRALTYRYYDVGCDFCGRHMSTDFSLGMAESSKQAQAWARDLGFHTKNGMNICPLCLGELESKRIK